MNNIVCFVPARKNSKGVPDKNIKQLGGKPLMAWTIEYALKIGYRTIVNTDSDKYADIAIKYGAEVQMRDKRLGEDDTSMFELLKSEIYRIDPVPDIVVLLQPTTPFRDEDEINYCVKQLIEGNSDSVITVERVPEKWNPAQVMVETFWGNRMANGSHISDRITKRQDYPVAFTPTGSVYCFKSKNLLNGSLYGYFVGFFETSERININSINDFIDAERFLRSLNIRNFCKDSEEYIDNHRSVGDFKESDRERLWLRSHGFSVKTIDNKTKVSYGK